MEVTCVKTVTFHYKRENISQQFTFKKGEVYRGYLLDNAEFPEMRIQHHDIYFIAIQPNILDEFFNVVKEEI